MIYQSRVLDKDGVATLQFEASGAPRKVQTQYDSVVTDIITRPLWVKLFAWLETKSRPKDLLVEIEKKETSSRETISADKSSIHKT